MKTSQVLEKTGIPRHKLYYLEQKGYIRPRRVPAGDLEAREYTKKDLLVIGLVWKYLQMGFRHKVAYKKSLDEIDRDAHARLKTAG
ncbi:MAG: MerR family transcriptional regulator [Deltaproteobacteria bacterium]|nr:MerR family transcriptional regulator [Deltaproteobacteria bacterium]